MKRRLTAILHADVVGYSRLSGENELQTHDQLASGLDLLTSTITKYEGQKINEAGDAILAEFESVVDAVNCANSFQLEMGDPDDAAKEGQRVLFRVGVNIGEVISDRNDIYGDGVNVAARIQELADPGGLCVTSAVYQQVIGKTDKAFDDLGHHQLKNITQSIHIYRARLWNVSSGIKNQPMFDLVDTDVDRSSLITGGCLCGNVKFEISQPMIGTGYCHCSICQKFCGAPVVAWAAFPVEAVRFTDSEPKCIESTLIGQRRFCGDCGTSISYMRVAPKRGWYLAIHTPCLDKPEEYAPAWHGGIESQLPWFQIHDDLPRTRCDEQPDLRQAWESVGKTEPLDWVSEI